jgi:membrane protease YdiL (CAAX protease family)
MTPNDGVLSEDQKDPPTGKWSPFSPNNHMFHLARLGRLRLPQSWLERQPLLLDKIIYPAAVLLFAYFVPVISTSLGLPLLIIPYFVPNMQQTVLNQFLILVGAFLPFFLLIWIWLWLFERRPLWSTGMERPFLKKYFRGLLWGLLMFTVVVILLALFGFLIPEAPLLSGLNPLAIASVLFVFLGWMVQGAAEELLARGFLLPVIGVRWGPLAGIVISSLFFALLHLSNPHVDFLSLLNLALFGFFAAIYTLYDGGLWGVFAIHAIWNWAQGNLYGLSVSGLEISGGILLDLVENGPDWLTGGFFGPEGGLVVTVVLIISTVLVGAAGRRQGRKTTDQI